MSKTDITYFVLEIHSSVVDKSVTQSIDIGLILCWETLFLLFIFKLHRKFRYNDLASSIALHNSPIVSCH